MRYLLSIYGVAGVLFLVGCGNRQGAPSADGSNESFVNQSTSTGNAAGSVEVQSVTITPYTDSQGQSSQSIQVTWKNTGSTPINTVRANLKGYDASGQSVVNVSDYTIYSWKQAVQPGEAYTTPVERGYMVPSRLQVPQIVRAEAKIVSAVEGMGF